MKACGWAHIWKRLKYVSCGWTGGVDLSRAMADEGSGPVYSVARGNPSSGAQGNKVQVLVGEGKDLGGNRMEESLGALKIQYCELPAVRCRRLAEFGKGCGASVRVFETGVVRMCWTSSCSRRPRG